jgi:hypothetical protein
MATFMKIAGTNACEYELVTVCTTRFDGMLHLEESVR